MNKYFDIKDKVYDVTEKYPELIEVLAGAGFENLKNDMMRKSMGKLLSLETALKSKNINVEVFEKQFTFKWDEATQKMGILISKTQPGNMPFPISVVMRASVMELNSWDKDLYKGNIAMSCKNAVYRKV